MTKDIYIAVSWPEVQDFMEHPRYYEEVCFDPNKNLWFLPQDLYDEVYSTE